MTGVNNVAITQKLVMNIILRFNSIQGLYMGIFTWFLKKSLLCVINRSGSLNQWILDIFSPSSCVSSLTILWFWSPVGVLLYRLYKVEDNETLRDFHTVSKLMFTISMLVQVHKIISMDFFLI